MITEELKKEVNKTRFIELVKKYHPDMHSGKEDKERNRFEELTKRLLNARSDDVSFERFYDEVTGKKKEDPTPNPTAEEIRQEMKRKDEEVLKKRKEEEAKKSHTVWADRERKKMEELLKWHEEVKARRKKEQDRVRKEQRG